MRRTLLLVSASLLSYVPAFGWGCEGHQMIALIARAHLTPVASAQVDRLLAAVPIDPGLNRYCKDRPADPMADAATWADDIRASAKTGDWHFIDIPLAVDPGSNKEDAKKWCPPAGGKAGCIVTAIDEARSTLANPARSPADRATALRYLIHFVEDLSQPLHASDNHDRGGNCTAITFLAQEKPENLHSVWDYRIIEKDLKDSGMTQSQYAAALDREFASRYGQWGANQIDVLAWAWESHNLARSAVYGPLKSQLPIAPAEAGKTDDESCRLERESMAARHVSIGNDYVRGAVPVIREQLAKAAYRLAAILNATFR